MIEELKNNKSIDIKNKNNHRILYKKKLKNLKILKLRIYININIIIFFLIFFF